MVQYCRLDEGIGKSEEYGIRINDMTGSSALIDPATVGQTDTSEWLFIDCRFDLKDTELGRKAYRQAHLPGAMYAHLDEDLSGPIVLGKTGRHPLPPKSEWLRNIRNWGIDNHTFIVAYDQGPGMFAARFWWMMKWAGHNAVRVLNGGWKAWRTLGLPIDKDVPVRETSQFEADWQDGLVRDAGYILQRINDPNINLVDVRDPERYAGLEEPIDPVAGHIPGAVNIPFKYLLTDDARWRSEEEMRDIFMSSALDPDAAETIMYCGSGVSACHEVLSYYQAGLGMPALYAGSWSDWITDEKRPVATE